MWGPPIEDFTSALNVNVSGVFYTYLAFFELLDEGNKRGNVEQKSSIIVTSSIAGFSRVLAAGFAYSASKAGVTHLVKILATYFSDYKIRVNAIAPGLFPSERTAGTPAFARSDKGRWSAKVGLPFGENWNGRRYCRHHPLPDE
jgi:NAD(P)-dependent dehydrogenase (short-subunit alcohol dehydrogenase family)